MATQGVKLLRGNVTVLIAYPEYAVDPLDPTAAELANVFDPTSNPDGMVFNVSCTLVDNAFTADKTESSTDNTRTICIKGEVQNKTFDNYEVSFDALRDPDVATVSPENIAFELFNGFNRPLYIITRFGFEPGDAFQAGQIISVFGVVTDRALDVVTDNSPTLLGARFATSGEINFNTEVQ